jgi:hypothetical protein
MSGAHWRQHSPNTRHKREVTENQAAAVARFASMTAQTLDCIEETRSMTTIRKHYGENPDYCRRRFCGRVRIWMAVAIRAGAGYPSVAKFQRGAGGRGDRCDRENRALIAWGRAIAATHRDRRRTSDAGNTVLRFQQENRDTAPPQVVQVRNSVRTQPSAISAAAKHDLDRQQDASADKSNGNATCA